MGADPLEPTHPGGPTTAAGAPPATPASPAGGPSASATLEAASAIATINALKAMALSAPTAADKADAIDKIGQWAAASPEAWSAAKQALQDVSGNRPGRNDEHRKQTEAGDLPRWRRPRCGSAHRRSGSSET